MVALKTWRLLKNCSRKVESASPNTSSILVDLSRVAEARYFSRYLLIYRAYGISDKDCNILILLAICLWVCTILIGLGKPKVCINLIGIGELIKKFHKEVEKENLNPRKLDKDFFWNPSLLQKKYILIHFFVRFWVL